MSKKKTSPLGVQDWFLHTRDDADAQAPKLSLGWQFWIACMVNLLSLSLPIMMLQVYDRIIPHQAYGTLALLTAGVLTALALDAGLRFARAWLAGWAAARHEHAANCAAINRFIRVDLTSFEETSTGTHLQNMNALGRLREFYSGQALMALVDLPFAIVFLGLIAYLGHSLVMVPLTLLAVFLVTARFAGARLRDALEARHHDDDKKSSFIVSVLIGMHTVKALAMEHKCCADLKIINPMQRSTAIVSLWPVAQQQFSVRHSGNCHWF